jgi:hypothetical protein
MARRVALVVALVAGIGTALVSAHHSFAAQYDRDKPITLKGSVTRIEWMNPHVYFYLDVADGAATAHWAIEGGAPTSLYRNGWRKDSLKVGDVVTVHGYLARDGTKLANMANAILADGREVLGGQQYYGPNAPTTKPPGQ